jgi:hypothetical protein
MRTLPCFLFLCSFLTSNTFVSGQVQKKQEPHLFQFKEVTKGKDDKWQIYDENKKLACRDTFQDYGAGYETFSAFAVAKKKDNWGVTDPHGKALIPFVYAGMDPFATCAGKVIAGRWEESELSKYSGRFLVSFGEAGLGAIDQNGQVVFKSADYGHIENRLDTFLTFVARTKMNFWGSLDTNGKVIIPFDTYKAFVPGISGPSLFQNLDGKYLVSDKKGIGAAAVHYDNYLSFYTSVLQKNRKWGRVSYDKTAGVPFVYDSVIVLGNEHLGLNQKGKWTIVNDDEKLTPVNTVPYDGLVTNDFDGNSYYTKLNGKWSETDITTFKIIRSIDCERLISFLGFDFLCMIKGGKTQLCDTKGKILIPYSYEKIDSVDLSNDYDLVKVYNQQKTGVWCMAKKEVLVPCVYDEVQIDFYREVFPNLELVKVFKSGKAGLYNVRKKKESVPCEYQDIDLETYMDSQDHSVIHVQLNDQWKDYILQ